MHELGAADPRAAETGFARLLARHRRSARLTQEGLAAASGISARTISDMERGRVRGPQHRTVQALAIALRLDEPTLWEFLRTAKAGRTRLGGRPADQSAGQPVEAGAAGSTDPGLGLGPGRGLGELPPDVADLTGRDDELARALDLIDAQTPTGRRAAMVISVFGAPGVGKTTFAAHLGHRLAPRYPDGSLFLDLRGLDAGRLTAGEALGRLLLALGVRETQLPCGTDARAGLYRALLRDKRVLLVLDNAADEAQVRPLLPSSPGCLVLVTSRSALPGLEAVHRLLLGVLRPAAAVELLASIIEPARVAAEPEAVAAVAALCGYLPLALRIAGNRLATRPRWSIASLERQLSDRRHRLSALTAGDRQVRTAFEVSYQQCREVTRLVFRRLSLVAGPDATVELAAVAAKLDPATTERSLEELVDASLLDTGPVGGRYVLHDLLRLFAGERLAAEETADAARLAERRLTGWVLDTGVRAGRLLWPSHPGTAEPGREPVAAIDSAEEAVRWLDRERPHWLATLRQAARAGRHAEVLAFCHAMHWYSDLRPAVDLWREVFGYGVRAATALGRRRDEAVQLNFLGWALNRIHRLHREALSTHLSALLAAREAGDRGEEAWSLQYCARAELDLGRAAEAVAGFRSAIELFGELGDAFGEHVTLSFLGLARLGSGQYEQAAADQHRAVGYFRRSDTVAHRNVLALCLLRLAGTLAATGDWGGAYATYREAGAVAVRAKGQRAEGHAWQGCGACQAALGDAESALQHFDVALTIFAGLDERELQAGVLREMAAVVEGSEPGRARAFRDRAAALAAVAGG
jgi:transcriptional regulator with XRE-family HTH domain/tetratricopeptide (TPR) repeat protein